MTSLDFSLKQAAITPIKPQLIDQLFSPRTKTPLTRPSVNDVTYQVPLNPSQPRVPLIDHYDDDDGVEGYCLTTNADKVHYFPRSSTGIKGPCPPCPVDIDESVASNLILDTNDTTTTTTKYTTKENVVPDETPIPQYRQIHQIKDTSPIRATCFHPQGDVYVVGSNSKKLKICLYPDEQEFKHFSLLCNEDDGLNNGPYPMEPEYAFQFLQIHRSSVYCVAFNDMGNLLATGSNDQTVHIVQYDSTKHLPKSNEYKLSTLHNGTIRDLMFMPNEENEKQSCYLVTAGAGNNEIVITDCDQGMKTLRVLSGHEATVMSLHHWEDKNMFYSGSLDGTIKLWDIRSKLCCSTINTNRLFLCMKSSNYKESTATGNGVNVVRVEDSGKLLVSGHKDGTCMLYDIRGGRVVQSFKAHDDEIRTLNFSPKSYYLLTGGYDNKIKLMDLQGELTNKLPSVEIGELSNKIVQAVWHPNDYNFITTCANGTATLWALPERF